MKISKRRGKSKLSFLTVRRGRTSVIDDKETALTVLGDPHGPEKKCPGEHSVQLSELYR